MPVYLLCSYLNFIQRTSRKCDQFFATLTRDRPLIRISRAIYNKNFISIIFFSSTYYICSGPPSTSSASTESSVPRIPKTAFQLNLFPVQASGTLGIGSSNLQYLYNYLHCLPRLGLFRTRSSRTPSSRAWPFRNWCSRIRSYPNCFFPVKVFQDLIVPDSVFPDFTFMYFLLRH